VVRVSIRGCQYHTNAPDVELRIVLLVTVVNCSDALLLTLARNQSRQNCTESQIVCRAQDAARRIRGGQGEIRQLDHHNDISSSQYLLEGEGLLDRATFRRSGRLWPRGQLGERHCRSAIFGGGHRRIGLLAVLLTALEEGAACDDQQVQRKRRRRQVRHKERLWVLFLMKNILHLEAHPREVAATHECVVSAVAILVCGRSEPP